MDTQRASQNRKTVEPDALHQGNHMIQVFGCTEPDRKQRKENPSM